MLTAQPDLTAFRPVVASVAVATVSSYPFQRAMQASIRSTVAAVLSEGSSKIALSVPDLGVLLRSALSQANPALAEKIPPRVRGAITDLGDGWTTRALVNLLRLSRRLAGVVVVLFGLGAVCVAAGFTLARDRRRALLDASVHLVAAGVVLLVLRAAGGWFLQSGAAEPLSRDAMAGVWAALTAGIRGWALTLAFVGLVTAASAQSVLDGFRSPPRWRGSGASCRTLRAARGAGSRGAYCSWLSARRPSCTRSRCSGGSCWLRAVRCRSSACGRGLRC